MKFSLQWMNDFIDTSTFFKDPQLLVNQLTQAGLEVDSFEDQTQAWAHVYVAKIIKIEKHPQADNLNLCQVSTGDKEYSIICGAKNYKILDHVVLALPKAKLAQNVIIKKTRIRGILSEGMLASRSELGLSNKKEEGIWILSKDSKLGSSFSKYLDLEDIIFDINIPANRSDCLSHQGLAREISCLFLIPFKDNKLTFKSLATLSVKKSISVQVQETDSCFRYCARLIQGVTIKESPPWLVKRLLALGLKSINNVVDITNFILHDRGQALHAFDRDKIQNIKVTLSNKGDVLQSLDKEKLTLTGHELIIRDDVNILALAGIIGGLDSSLSASTKNIFIESAVFAAQSIRKTSRHFGIETQSSYLFSRGVDVQACKQSMDLACALIQQVAGGDVSEDYYDICHKNISDLTSIKISLKELESRLAYKISVRDFEDWMTRLGCKITNENSIFHVSIPAYRQDLQIKEDLIEEFARLNGYDKIPEQFPRSLTVPAKSNASWLNSRKLINFLSGKGWNQAINYSFCDSEYYKEFLNNNLFLEDLGSAPINKLKKSFLVKNPISKQLNLMKPLLSPDMFKQVVSNFRYNNTFGKMFEVSPVFYQNESGEYKQNQQLALAMWGQAINIWSHKELSHFYTVKSFLETLFSVFKIKVSYVEIENPISFLHPKKTLLLNFQNRTVGFLGSVHPEILQKNKIPVDVVLAEVCWEALSSVKNKDVKFKAFSKLLTVEKDLCFVIPKSIPAESIKKEIQNSLGSRCQEVHIFDIYQKDQQDRSVSFRLRLMPQKQTWTDAELQNVLKTACHAVDKKFSVRLK